MAFAQSSTIKSPFSPRVRQSISGRRSIGLSSTKKNQSKYMQGVSTGEIIYKTPLSTIETYGIPLPVMVSEALTFGAGRVSVRMSECGWSWLVRGRRVLCWPRAAAASARELALPQTDLAHKADLVMLFYEEGAQMPSCVGVSPEGTIRYWQSVAGGVYTDISVQLAGQECDRLTEPVDGRLLLATTTCTAVMLSPQIVDGRATLSCRTLRPPSGWLGGLGRRVSLLFFGSMPAHAETKLVNIVLIPGVAEGGAALLTSSGVLQLWREELTEHDLREMLLAKQPGVTQSIELLALDMVWWNNGLLLLLATPSPDSTEPTLRYGIAHISVFGSARVTSSRWFRGARLAAPRLLPHACRHALYTQELIATVSVNTQTTESPDITDVSSTGDRILGGGRVGSDILLFTARHGLAVLRYTQNEQGHDSICDSPMGSPCPSDMYDGNLSLYEIDPHEVSVTCLDACGKLKSAFLFHVRGDTAERQALLQELGVGGMVGERVEGGNLGPTVVTIATQILDDVPNGDPRWKVRGQTVPTHIPLGSSGALQITAQLRDKQRAFALFLGFLRDVGLIDQLGNVSRESGGGSVSVKACLVSLSEKLALALALRQLQQGSHAAVIDSPIYQVVNTDHPDFIEDDSVMFALTSGALSATDACYRRVSRIDHALSLVAREQANVVSQLTVLTTCFSEMLKSRAVWATRLACRTEPAPRPLAAACAAFMRKCVLQYGPECNDTCTQAQIYELSSKLADLLLADAEPLQQSSYTVHQYDKLRKDLIEPFVTVGQKERAAALAEKFKDFELLISLCVDSDDFDKLYQYIEKYSDEGMAELTFASLVDRGGSGKARLIRAASNSPRLYDSAINWLQSAPSRAPLLALLKISAGGKGAGEVLADLAVEEGRSLQRMTTMASLAKLCLVASDTPQDSEQSEVWRKVENRLTLSEQHDALPRDIRLHHGMDGEDTRVFDPEELVQMYIDSKSGFLSEYDYKKALDLTEFIEDPERRDDLRLRVWCASIRQDDWSRSSPDAQAALQERMFFRLVDLVHVMGGDLKILLPPMEDILTAPELAELVSDPQVHYIIKYGYECLDADRSHSMIEA